MADTSSESDGFPPLENALDDPNGLLAIGGELSRERLIEAYNHGIFPWYDEDQPILWWSPDPRAVIEPAQVHASRSLKRSLRRKDFRLTIDTAFDSVIDCCAAEREGSDGTWITQVMRAAYIDLHTAGIAHSFEVWDQDELIGGLYGVASGQVFSGESMFHRRTDASKIAFVFTCMQLQRWNFKALDCQIENDHLSTLGVVQVARQSFKQWLPAYQRQGIAGAKEFNRGVDWATPHYRSTRELYDNLL